MKKVAGTLKLDQALFREREAFSKFGGDLDAATRPLSTRCAQRGNPEAAAVHTPYSVEKQVAIIYLGTKQPCARRAGEEHAPL
jgi:F-type H+-transporting ATPase subunit alpha